MSQLTQRQVDSIASQVADLLHSRGQGSHQGATESYQGFVVPPGPAPTATGVSAEQSPEVGVFADVRAAVKAARQAQRQLISLTLKQREEIIASIRTQMLLHVEDLAQRAQAETGLGRAEDKVLKNRLVTEKTPGPEVLKPVAYSGDRGLTLMELAPYGVIAAITPSTNPTTTIICNTIGMVSAGNAVVFNAHPAARQVSLYNVGLLNQAITVAGGPPNLVTTVARPTIETAQELMHHPGVRLLVVTGGSAVVKAAMTSGKRAICAGPGNPPVVVDESADLERAAKSIVSGGSLDNNIICTSEKEVFVVDSVADQLLAAFRRYNAVVLKPHEIERLERVIFQEIRGQRQPAEVDKSLIGKNVQVILAKIGIQLEDHIRLAIAPVSAGHPLVWSEQMLPVIPVVRMPNVAQAIEIAVEAEHGFRHTAVMHSKNLDNLHRMARTMDCSIFVKNGPSLAGLGYGGEGYCSFTIASPTGEGMTGPRSFARERRCVLVDHFRIV